jgi:hypothetical protein
MSYPKALYHRGTVRGGRSIPQFFEIEDVGLAVVKFLQNRQGPKVLVNEIIGFGVASLLELQHPNVGIVEIDKDVLPNGRLVVSAEGEDCIFEPGLHFYSEWLSNADVVSPLDLERLGAVQNPQMLAGVVVLDLLLDNWDRDLDNLNLLLHRERGGQKLKLIDLGYAFSGPFWMEGNLHPHPQHGYFPSLEEPLHYGNLDKLLKTVKKEDIDLYLSHLRQVTKDKLEGIIMNIPNDWQLTSGERLSLLNCLLERAKGLPDYFSKRLEKEAWWL